MFVLFQEVKEELNYLLKVVGLVGVEVVLKKIENILKDVMKVLIIIVEKEEEDLKIVLTLFIQEEVLK